MIIDFHSHFFPQRYLTALGKKNASVVFEQNSRGGGFLGSGKFRAALASSHYDVAERVAAMDAVGVDVQCLTPTIPGVHTERRELGIYLAQAFNDGSAEAVAAYPDRFAAIAVLPLQDPAASVIELDPYSDNDYGKGAGEVHLALGRRMQSTNSPNLLAKGRSEILQDLWATESGVDSAEDDLNRSRGR